MKDTIEFYSEENLKIFDSYEKGIEIIKKICSDTKQKATEPYKFFHHTSNAILKLADIERNFNEEYFNSKSIEELKSDNYNLYAELINDYYDSSYANPKYAVEVIGDGIGQLLSTFYSKIRDGIAFAYKNRVFNLQENNQLFIELYNAFIKNGADYEIIKNIITKPMRDNAALIRATKYECEERVNPKFKFYSNIVFNSDLSDLRYLFQYDKYISENEVKMAEFLIKYPEDKIKTLAKSAVAAYLRGFIVDNKDRGNRDIVKLPYMVGQEIIIKHLVNEFKANGFECTLSDVLSTNPNKQYSYDHRFDNYLYLDEAYTKLKEETYDIAFKTCENLYKRSSGVMVFDSFGEQPFSPVAKKECFKLTDEQQKLLQTHYNSLDEIYYKYEPNENVSFCIIALPSPQIGDNFNSIFEDTLIINMMDNNTYEPIQQRIIDVLDKGEFVHILGKNGNKTDIKVKLPELKDPERQTNFVNCVADVNIPLGEVFTSPELKGTNGILHLKDTFLDLKYTNLELEFKDGYVTNYNCSNFDKEEENRNYVKENLLQTHDMLPLGEFAIGTNTEAYMMAKRYGIIELLPILIIEKMGPHFAIGDTCFSWSEDLPVYNILNKKEIVARDNEKTILRKQDISKAYTGVHTDITIPYEEIHVIAVITKDGQSIDIIRDGRFVLEGTEVLNKPFDRM